MNSIKNVAVKSYPYHLLLMKKESISEIFINFDFGVFSKEFFTRKLEPELEPELGKAD